MPSVVVTLENTEKQQKLKIDPPSCGLSLQGRLRIPGDKSISHRALMLGALAEGVTTIEGLLLGADPRSTAECFSGLGAEISELNSQQIKVKGCGIGNLQEPDRILDAGNSGTTMRLMLGILASHPDRLFTITGDSSLVKRPMDRVIAPLTQMGATIWGRRSGSFAPLAVHGQQLQPIHYHSPIASAQVKSCILLAGLMVEGATTVTEPALSRDHTERMLKAFGAQLTVNPDTNSVTVFGPAKLQGQTVIVPGDISSAAFWLVAASIVPGSDITIENVGVNPTRTGILEAMAMMGADIQSQGERLVAGEPVADLRVRFSPLKACEIKGDLIPRLIDEIPILAVAAAFAEGTTTIRDAAELRVKESDRIQVMATELTKMGAKISELPDGLEITGGFPLRGAEVDSDTDHRIAMSLAIAALNAAGSTTIHRAEAAAISYPDFVGSLQQLIINN
ncbi:MAG: 3-phosphoshikimate 1-carboxyvinyltransferase [Limnospira sp. PMC 1291.21]|uniref:3-phosphoshikimate 1-carboxyvinyltransferase n=2 Tax=Limnospira TaxID=2596745 RepID=A0A9P1KIL1_9CYAN|nr:MULTISPECIES: 3-phosphoshikimate 1-carboxyvinyltransferase [Limnospira]EKD08177.1 3-phosphoshikimate 1-carboxyvinyltransferase [Arthrospira platensis C1]MDC0840482.1 3-phosphoshikimate 1-carboxyvinyltransferase [Limnoraphis robusta]MDY7052697.1 3-phosphoshikimate 1-carboxyvinyltransferase [Limnospira fusiformis LS22]QJB25235.1 3-phosphoshikimate 1-carboxyvinyltransferase [Limnospira fusiformis SAG 85.79]MDT9176833.1 3-phosphoshikimate 1-carboxyvinyltransferase [Limnospira sp. PMC 1238.20]